jgi:hypothetical protein
MVGFTVMMTLDVALGSQHVGMQTVQDVLLAVEALGTTRVANPPD